MCRCLNALMAFYSRFISLAIKHGSTQFFFLKCPVPSQKYDSCYQIVRFYVCWAIFLCNSSVFLLFRFFSSKSWCISPSLCLWPGIVAVMSIYDYCTVLHYCLLLIIYKYSFCRFFNCVLFSIVTFWLSLKCHGVMAYTALDAFPVDKPTLLGGHVIASAFDWCLDFSLPSRFTRFENRNLNYYRFKLTPLTRFVSRMSLTYASFESDQLNNMDVWDIWSVLTNLLRNFNGKSFTLSKIKRKDANENNLSKIMLSLLM